MFRGGEPCALPPLFATVFAMTNGIAAQRVAMPGRLKGVLAILGFQILANAFVGFLVLDAVLDATGHGADVDGAGLAYFLVFLSFAVALTLLVSAVLTPSRMPWIRPTVIVVESIGILGGAINLLTGQLAAVIGILLAIAVITSLNRDEVRDYQGDRK